MTPDTTLPVVPGGHGILDIKPCLVLGQEMSIITRGLQYSTLMLGSLEEAGALSSSSGTKPSTGVWAGATTVVVVRGHWAITVVVAGILVVVVLAVVVVMVIVVGRVVVLVVMVVVSMYTMTEEDVSATGERWNKVNRLILLENVGVEKIRWRVNVFLFSVTLH